MTYFSRCSAERRESPAGSLPLSPTGPSLPMPPPRRAPGHRPGRPASERQTRFQLSAFPISAFPLPPPDLRLLASDFKSQVSSLFSRPTPHPTSSSTISSFSASISSHETPSFWRMEPMGSQSAQFQNGAGHHQASRIPAHHPQLRFLRFPVSWSNSLPAHGAPGRRISAFCFPKLSDLSLTNYRPRFYRLLNDRNR